MDTFKLEEAFDSEGFCFSKEKKLKHVILGALPSETVQAEQVGRKRRETFNIIQDVLEPHPARVKAPCSDSPRCGGCTQQALDYSWQLKFKETKIKSLFPDQSDRIRPILGSPHIFGYRSKMDFSFSQNKAGQKFLGLTQAKGNGRVIMTNHCHLASPWMNFILKEFQQKFLQSPLMAYDRRQTGDLRSLIVRQPSFSQEKMIVLEVVAHQGSELKKKDLIDFFESIHSQDPLVSCYLRIVQMIPKVPTQIYEMHLKGPLAIHETLKILDKTLTFKISPSAFFQPNSHSAEVLFTEVVKIVKSLQVKTVCDLFCGTGTISLCVAPYVEECIGVELNPYAVFDAQENANINHIKNVSFLQQDAALFIKENQRHFDLVIVDPPRAGLGKKACDMIKELSCSYILYVSCNPVTQSLDCKELSDAGYGIELIQPLDQFPHTNHCENIVLLKKHNS